jgi:hypothetical protein
MRIINETVEKWGRLLISPFWAILEFVISRNGEIGKRPHFPPPDSQFSSDRKTPARSEGGVKLRKDVIRLRVCLMTGLAGSVASGHCLRFAA